MNGAIDDGALGIERRQRDITYFGRHLPSVKDFKSVVAKCMNINVALRSVVLRSVAKEHYPKSRTENVPRADVRFRPEEQEFFFWKK